MAQRSNTLDCVWRRPALRLGRCPLLLSAALLALAASAGDDRFALTTVYGHRDPSTTSPRAFRLVAGDVVRVVDASDTWSHVVFEKKEGWVASEYIGDSFLPPPRYFDDRGIFAANVESGLVAWIESRGGDGAMECCGYTLTLLSLPTAKVVAIVDLGVTNNGGPYVVPGQVFAFAWNDQGLALQRLLREHQLRACSDEELKLREHVWSEEWARGRGLALTTTRKQDKDGFAETVATLRYRSQDLWTRPLLEDERVQVKTVRSLLGRYSIIHIEVKNLGGCCDEKYEVVVPARLVE